MTQRRNPWFLLGNASARGSLNVVGAAGVPVCARQIADGGGCGRLLSIVGTDGVHVGARGSADDGVGAVVGPANSVHVGAGGTACTAGYERLRSAVGARGTANDAGCGMSPSTVGADVVRVGVCARCGRLPRQRRSPVLFGGARGHETSRWANG